MKQPFKEPQYETMLTTRQVADFLQVSVCSVRRWSDRGTLKFYRIGSRGDRRYWREDVLNFLELSSRHSSFEADKNAATIPTGRS